MLSIMGVLEKGRKGQKALQAQTTANGIARFVLTEIGPKRSSAKCATFAKAPQPGKSSDIFFTFFCPLFQYFNSR